MEGQTLTPVKASANDQNLVQDNSIGVSQAGSALTSIPDIGKALESSLKAGAPNGASLVVVYAQASPDGQSDACAALFAASCSNGKLTPLVVKVGLDDLDPAIANLPVVGSVLSSATSLVGDDLELSITGPEAICTAGPADSSGGLHATAQPGTVTASIVDSSGNTVGSPVQLKSGDIFSQLGSLGLPASLASQLPLGLTTTAGSTQYGSGTASATTGEFSLTSQGKKALDIASATATCGPNTATGSTGSSGSTGSTGSTGSSGTTGSTTPGLPDTSATSPVPTPSATSSEKPLTKIQTDEGRSTPKPSGRP